jgi:hypothetical protein
MVVGRKRSTTRAENRRNEMDFVFIVLNSFEIFLYTAKTPRF